jgi:hypothetical protein
LHARTVRVLARIVAMKWEPIACQVPVNSPESRVATFVDMLCWDKATRRYVLAEIKTGFATGYKIASGPMSAPLQAHDDSPYHQHQLQALATRLLFMHTYKCKPAEVVSCVLRVDATCSDIAPTPSWVSTLEPELKRRLTGSA